MQTRGVASLRRAAAVTLVGAVLLVTGCAGGTAAPETSAPSPAASGSGAVVLDDSTTETLQAAFEEAFGSSGMPGATAYVQIGDDVWTSTLGVGDLETDEPFDPEAIVRIASNTKTFTATAVLQLVDEGRLSLDDTLDTFVPGITNGDTITVRNLLQMSSGIWEFSSDPDLLARWNADLNMPWTVDESIALMQGKPAQFAPGEKVVYTDSNYVLLGRILEEVTGMSAAEAITSMIIEPLGLSDTRFPAPGQSEVPDPHQQGYRPPAEELGDIEALQPVGDINPEVAWTAGNMTSTMADLVTWVTALADGELLSDELQAERLESERFDGQQINFGYGLGVVKLNDFIGHDGAIMGYSSVAMRDPEADATFVIVGNASTNSTTPTLDIFIAMLQQLYPEQLS